MRRRGLCAAWEACKSVGEKLRPGLLQRDGALPGSRTAGSTEEGAEILREGAVPLYASGDTELGVVCEIADSPDPGAGKLSLVRWAGFSGEHWRVQVSEQAR